MKQLAVQAREDLLAGRLEELGTLLHEGWELKKRMASQVSNGSVDNLYLAARRAGALGGKLTGAGGGGFMVLVCPPDKRASVRTALGHLQELPFGLEADGTKVIFNYRRS
jgi:D-glycero-alpha-D-manno-heptose-7-phosphate kinase